MALNKLVRRLNLESETVDITDVEEPTAEEVVEQDIVESDVKEASDELKELQEDFEEGEATAEELQEAIDHTKEVIAAAESKAEESGEEAEVPVEEIVAAQESLRYFYKQIGLDPSEMITVSREDIHTNSLQAYKELKANLESLQTNLEGILGNIGSKLKEAVKKATTKLLAFLGNIKATSGELLKALNEVNGEVPSTANEAFVAKNKKLGYNAEFYTGSILPIINEIYTAYSQLLGNLANGKESSSKNFKASKYAKYVQGAKGLVVCAYPGANGKLVYVYVEDTPAGTAIDYEVIPSKPLEKISLDKNTAIKYVSALVQENNAAYSILEKLDKTAEIASTKDQRYDGHAARLWTEGYGAINDTVNSNFSFVKKYATAVIKALKSGK